MKIYRPTSNQKINEKRYLEHCRNIALIIANTDDGSAVSNRIQKYCEVTDGTLRGDKDE